MITDAQWAEIEKSLGFDIYGNERREFEAGDITPTGQRIGDWQDFIPDYVRERWDKLDETGRLCVFVMAKAAAEENAASPRWDE